MVVLDGLLGLRDGAPVRVENGADAVDATPASPESEHP